MINIIAEFAKGFGNIFLSSSTKLTYTPTPEVPDLLEYLKKILENSDPGPIYNQEKKLDRYIVRKM